MTTTLSFLILALATSTQSIAQSGITLASGPSFSGISYQHNLISQPIQRSQPSTGLPLAQARPLPSATSGTQISLNGQTYRVPWTIWNAPTGSRFGVAEGAFSEMTGAQLDNTNDANAQPLSGFNRTPPLPVQLVGTDRYLDITDWVTAQNWQLQVTPQGPQITTPPAKLQQIQQIEGDRIILQLDRPTPFQVGASAQEWVLSLDATVEPSTLTSFKPQPSKRLSSLKVEADPTRSKTLLRLGIPITSRPVMTYQPDLGQWVIEIGSPDTQVRSRLWAPGLLWRQNVVAVGSQNLTLQWIELDPKRYQLRPVLPNLSDLAGIAPLPQTARQGQSLVAINGGFFNRVNQLPLGMVQIDRQLLSGPILNRGVMAWDNAGNFRFDRYSIQETAILTSPAGTQSIPLTHLNSAYVQAGVARYTRQWGPQYKTFADNEIVLTVVGNQVVDQKAMTAAGGIVPIPAEGYLLVVRSNQTLAATIPTGSTVQLQQSETPNGIAAFPQVLGAGPLLIQNQRIVLDAASEKFSAAFIRERAARSAIARASNGNLFLATVHNTTGGPGATLEDWAKLLQQLGAIDALNLDGGSSTSMYLGGEGGQVIDRPSRSSARVHNAIGLFAR